MAVNVSVYNLENYPNNPKTVSVDLTELVPYGNGGEDAWVLSALTSATASGGAAIQRLYINHIKFGWAKSSGLKSGPYDVTNVQRHLKVAIDEDIGSAAEIALSVSDLPIGGDAVAKDMQTKINALALTGGAKAGNLSYLNAIVRYVNGVFEVISGTASSLYTGVDRTSVVIADGTTTTGMLSELGFDIPFTSQSLATTQVKQTSLASPYSSGLSLSVVNGALVSNGDCIAITDGSNTAFRGVQTVVGNTLTLASGIGNSFAAGSLIQVLGFRDPSGEPPPIYTRVDDIVNHGVNSIVNQIDFSR